MTIKTRTTSKAAAPQTDHPKRKTLTRARKADSSKVAEAKTADIPDSTPPALQAIHGVELEGLDRPVTGRGVFAVRTLGNAVSVESAFLEENGNVLRLPAVFPNRQYALEQLEELWQLVNRHFEELENAAKAGK